MIERSLALSYLQAADAPAAAAPAGLSGWGLALMIVSVGGVLTLVATCYYRVLTAKRNAD